MLYFDFNIILIFEGHKYLKLMSNALFFIAIIPNKSIAAEIYEFKNYASEEFMSKRALSSPAHITIYPPFRMGQQMKISIDSELNKLADKQDSFYITLNSFSNFRKQVIYVDVEKSDTLNKLYYCIKERMDEILLGKIEKEKPFHPHMTIAFRDLTKENFIPAWSYFEKQDYFRVFESKSFYLLRHDGKKWNVINEYNFNLINS